MNITEINELLKKAFQQECYLEGDQLKFPNLANIVEFEKVESNCEKFLSQYDIKTGANSILYSEGTSKVFALRINKLTHEKILKQWDALRKDIQLHEILNPNAVLQVNILLDNGANINSKNIIGDTPLHIAVQNDYDPIASLLIERGALILPNNSNETALQIADQKKDTLMGKSLINAVLNIDPKTKKPDFIMQELRNYWDEQIKKLADKPIDQSCLEGATGGVVKTSGEKKVRNIIQFFSSTNSLNTEKQLKELSTMANLGK